MSVADLFCARIRRYSTSDHGAQRTSGRLSFQQELRHTVSYVWIAVDIL